MLYSVVVKADSVGECTVTVWAIICEAIIKMLGLNMVLNSCDDFMRIVTNIAIVFSINVLFQELDKILRIRN